MANESHLKALLSGVDHWNEWIRLQRLRHGTRPHRHPGAGVGISYFWPDFTGADLQDLDLYQGKAGEGWRGIDLSGADFTGANLRGTKLAWSHLVGATFADADLSGAELMNARLHGANFSGAKLRGVTLGGASLHRANLSRSDLTNAYLYSTEFSDTNLDGATGLSACRFAGPCTVDHRTMFDYQPLPFEFLRGCGLPQALIDYLPSLRGTPIQFYTCFISYSSKDQLFAERLHADLQAKGVRCWFAPHDLPIGAKTWDAIDEQIQLRDKVLLVLSRASIASDWVEDEVNKAFAEERERKKTVLFPIRIDDDVMAAAEPWARKLRDQRNIGDFLNWNDPAKYQTSLARVLRDLSENRGSSSIR